MLLLLLAVSAATPARDEPPRPEVPTGRQSTLIMLVRVASNLKIKEIENTLEVGLEKSGCRCDLPMRIRAISPVVFNAFNTGSETPLGAGEKKDFSLQRVPELPSVWLVTHKLGSALDSLEVEVQGATKKYARTFKPEFRTARPDAPLAMLFPGIYALRLGDDELPVSYKASLTETKSGKAWEAKSDVPPSDRHYMIFLSNFTGSREHLFDTIRERPDMRNLVANPVKDLEEARDLTIVFASWGMSGSRKPPSIVGNKYIPTIDAPVGRSIDRVWIRFPIDADKLADELKEYRDLDSLALIKKIESEGPARGLDDVTTGPDTKTRWIELPPKVGSENRQFTRVISLKNIQGLQRKYKKVGQLVVWEFGRQAVLIENPKDRTQSVVLAEELSEWPLGIGRLVEEEKKRDAAKKAASKKE